MYNLKKLLASVILLGFSFNVFAVPALQVDIEGGTYVGGTEESVMSSADSFTSYVYGNTSSIDATEQFFMSIAIVTNGAGLASGVDFGSFEVNGITYSLADLTYGTPPVDALYKDISTHSIYDTYYLELAFYFDTSSEYELKNVQDTGVAGTTPVAGTGMYAQAFDISRIGLSEGFELHFDAYNEALGGKDRIFAPYSHDAGTYSVSETGSLFLLMVGLIGLVSFKRKIS